MDLSKPIQYTSGSGKWSLVGPVRCGLDNELIELCTRFESMNSEQRVRSAILPKHSETRWTLFMFAQRMAVFALRDNNPNLLATGLVGLGLVSDRIDPRDIMSASAKLIYVAQRLGLNPLELAENGRTHHSRIQELYLNVAQRDHEVDWHSKHWGFCEIDSELGVGLIGSRGSYDPTIDLVGLAMRICRIVEADSNYSATSLQIDQPRGAHFAPNRGGLSMSGIPNQAAHAQMKDQSLKMRLVEFETVADADRWVKNHQVASNEVSLTMAYDRLIFTLTARSWVKDVATLETSQSIQRFEAPIASLVQNFRRYRWQVWQAYESDGSITLTTKDLAGVLSHDGLLAADSRLLYEFDAATGEEASTIHYERMGWQHYKPLGEPSPCPNLCGSYYYPLGSGDCHVCGHIG